jgi:hypothetical protein
MADEIDLLEDFRALVSALEREGIEYAVVGALALAVHGFPRATKDIDLLIRKEDLGAVLRVAEPIGYRFPAEPMTFRDGMELQRVTKVAGGDHLTLDLLFVDDRLEGVWASRKRVQSQRGSITVISRDALVEMKARAGRPQDLADLERLRGEEEG